MRVALTIAFHRDGLTTELLAGAETPAPEQRAQFKVARAQKTHPDWDRVEFWESDIGRVLRHSFDVPAAGAPTVEAPKSEVQLLTHPVLVEVPTAPEVVTQEQPDFVVPKKRK